MMKSALAIGANVPQTIPLAFGCLSDTSRFMSPIVLCDGIRGIKNTNSFLLNASFPHRVYGTSACRAITTFLFALLKEGLVLHTGEKRLTPGYLKFPAVSFVAWSVTTSQYQKIIAIL